MDDPFVSCPYERAHRVPRSRLQAHLVRCARRGPALAVCPYDATHRVPPPQLPAHVQACAARLPFAEPRPRPRRALACLAQPDHRPDEEYWDD